MTKPANASADDIDRLLVEEEARRCTLKAHIKRQMRLGEDPTDAQAELGEIEAILSALSALRRHFRAKRKRL